MDYWEWKLWLKPVQPWNEIAVALLADNGFDSFVDFEEGVLAYAPVNQLAQSDQVEGFLIAWAKENDIEFRLEKNLIPHQNWNEKWESDFEPVYIDSYCSILAPFHSKDQAQGLIIEIQPQMSFGTGHHQTTYLICKALFEMGPIPENVLDMGSGTGILAILAEKLGAKDILAIDIEDWSAENVKENALRNNCTQITSLAGDIELIEGKTFGMILANINRNVLLSHLPSYYEHLEKGGKLMLSGFFVTDEVDMIESSKKLGLNCIKSYQKDNWAALLFEK